MNVAADHDAADDYPWRLEPCGKPAILRLTYTNATTTACIECLTALFRKVEEMGDLPATAPIMQEEHVAAAGGFVECEQLLARTCR